MNVCRKKSNCYKRNWPYFGHCFLMLECYQITSIENYQNTSIISKPNITLWHACEISKLALLLPPKYNPWYRTKIFLCPEFTTWLFLRDFRTAMLLYFGGKHHNTLNIDFVFNRKKNKIIYIIAQHCTNRLIFL